jgi:hypothetical protein
MRPGWVEFPPIWGRNLHTGPADRYSEEVIAKVFELAMANARGKLSEIETGKRIARLRREIETRMGWDERVPNAVYPAQLRRIGRLFIPLWVILGVGAIHGYQSTISC